MNRLLSADLARLRKHILFLFGVSVMLIYGIVAPIQEYSETVKYAQLSSPDKLFGGYIIPVCIITAFLCCVFCAEEYDNGTVRNKLSVGHSRANVYTSQFFTCLIAGIIMCLAYVIPSTLLDLMLLGDFERTTDVLVLYLTSGILCISACISVYCMLITFMQKRTAGTALTLFVMLIVIDIGIITGQNLKLPAETFRVITENGVTEHIYGENPHYPKGIYRTFLEILYDFLPSSQAWQITYMSAEHLPRMIVSSCMIIIISFLSGMKRLEKKDLK
ncbi:MAG: ABC transporter permease [Oscillospiraceae bacterium]|nr:ABC transporter permease [Oscillospiraceae bacterium]